MFMPSSNYVVVMPCCLTLSESCRFTTTDIWIALLIDVSVWLVNLIEHLFRIRYLIRRVNISVCDLIKGRRMVEWLLACVTLGNSLNGRDNSLIYYTLFIIHETDAQ